VSRPAVVATASSEQPLVAGFKGWLRKHRRASDAAIKLYARDADLVSTALGADTAASPADVRGYFMERASTCGLEPSRS
jgi:hypothetical protein